MQPVRLVMMAAGAGLGAEQLVQDALTMATSEDQQSLGHRHAMVKGHHREVGQAVGDGAAECLLTITRLPAKSQVGERDETGGGKQADTGRTRGSRSEQER